VVVARFTIFFDIKFEQQKIPCDITIYDFSSGAGTAPAKGFAQSN